MKQPNRPANRPIEAKTSGRRRASPERTARTGSTADSARRDMRLEDARFSCQDLALPVSIGPPAPPAPTIVQFDRNVVVLRGRVDEQPGQLTCDNLKLTLVPSENAPVSRPAGFQAKDPDGQADGSSDKASLLPRKSPQRKGGLFGGLALKRAHATGHAVWLYLPADGIKLGATSSSI